MRNLIAPPSTRIEAIKLFTEISQVNLSDESEEYQTLYREKTCLFYCLFIEQIANVTKQRDFREEYQNVSGSKQQTSFENFARQVCLAISSVLTQNLSLIEQTTNTMDQNQNIEFLKRYTQRGLQYLIQCTNIPEDELFKICLDFWHFFTLNNLK